MDQTYWAAKEGSDLASELNDRRTTFLRYLDSQGYIARWRNAMSHYYGQTDKNSSYVSSGGIQGELALVADAEYPSLLKQIHTMVTQQRITWQTKAVNTDTKSLTQTILARGILDYYLRKSGLDTYISKATETSLVVDWSWVTAEWDTTRGNPVAGQIAYVREGDIKYQSKLPSEVAYDILAPDIAEIPWAIVDEIRSKYELANQFPEFADEILAVQADKGYEAQYSLDNLSTSTLTVLKSDMIRVATFHHKPTNALPTGRYALFIPGGSVLSATPSPYDELPIVRISPAELIGRSLGFTQTSHLLGLQECINGIVSALVTNVSTFGVTSIWTGKDPDLDARQLANGMTVFESTNEPKPINFAGFPPQMLNFLEFIIKRSEAISGISSVVRGQNPGDLSGAAMALLTSQSLQFQSGLQRSFAILNERLGQLTLSHLQKFPNSQRLTAIAGSANQWMMKTWAKKDISDVVRVFVDLGNPLANTVSGRMTLGETLIKNHMISPQEYIQIIETGTLEPSLESQERQMLTLRDENEKLQSGIPVKVILIENHPQHIKSHLTVIASPETKEDDNLVKATLDHIQSHLNEWKNTPPEMLAALGIPPFPSPMMPQPGMPPGPGAPQPQGMPHPSNAPAQVQNAESPIAQAGEKVGMPSMPKVAGTNQKFQPPGGPQAMPQGVR